MNTNKEFSKQLETILDDLFYRGVRYGKDIDYAKGDVLYILREDSLIEMSRKIMELIKTIK